MTRISAMLFAFVLMSSLMAEDAWQPAVAGYKYEFPRDHGNHPQQKIEWWYYTGHLDTREGRSFGYQLTFFRIGITPKTAIDSPWAVRDLWMTHLAVSDLKTSTYHHDDRLNRAGPGFAGAANGHLQVWNEDWSATQSTNGFGPMMLKASNPKFGLELELIGGKPVVIHGKEGISQKGVAAGNASHYYSLTRMPTQGVIRLGSEKFEVTGHSWMDHEFGTSFLEPEQRGWDWISLQLDDGSDLMLFQLRRSDGTVDSHTSGTWVPTNGPPIPLTSSDFTLLPADEKWTSPVTKGQYPMKWRISIPGRQTQLEIRTVFPDQEMLTRSTPGLHYWEGCITAEGLENGKTIKGRGYLEMTGYSGPAMSRWFSPPTSE